MPANRRPPPALLRLAVRDLQAASRSAEAIARTLASNPRAAQNARDLAGMVRDLELGARDRPRRRDR